MRQQRAGKKKVGAEPRTFDQVMGRNVTPINGSRLNNLQSEENALGKDDFSGPCTVCTKESLPWGRVVLANGSISHVCGADCQRTFDKERSEKISASYKSVVVPELQKATESIQLSNETNRRRPRPTEQRL